MEHSVGREVVVGRAGCGAAWPQSSGRGGWVRVRASARRARRRRNAAMSGTARLADGGGAARAPAHRGSRAARTNGPRRGLRKRGPSAPPPALPAPRARAGACGALTESRRAPPGGAGCSRSRSSAAWWCLRERACAGIAHGTTAHVFHVEPERRRPVRAADGSAGGGGGAGAIGGGREWGPLVRAGRGRRCAGARAAPAPVESRAAPGNAAFAPARCAARVRAARGHWMAAGAPRPGHPRSRRGRPGTRSPQVRRPRWSPPTGRRMVFRWKVLCRRGVPRRSASSVGRAGCGAAWPRSFGRGKWARARAPARGPSRRRNAATTVAAWPSSL